MSLWRVVGAGLVLLTVAGCSKETLLRSALEDPEERKDTFQLTLKILDEHPEYVDELFVLAREHDATFDELVRQVAVALDDPAFAAKVASKLAGQPKAVELITRAMLVEARNNPELRRALAAAILSEGDVMHQIVEENPELVRRVLTRTLQGQP